MTLKKLTVNLECDRLNNHTPWIVRSGSTATSQKLCFPAVKCLKCEDGKEMGEEGNEVLERQ